MFVVDKEKKKTEITRQGVLQRNWRIGKKGAVAALKKKGTVQGSGRKKGGGGPNRWTWGKGVFRCRREGKGKLSQQQQLRGLQNPIECEEKTSTRITLTTPSNVNRKNEERALYLLTCKREKRPIRSA